MAAKLGGFLPAWRDGKVFDIDLVTDETSARTIATTYQQEFRPHAPGSVCVWQEVKFDIDFAKMPERGVLLDRLCPAPLMVEVAGRSLLLRIAPIEVVWSIRAFTVGLTSSAYEKGIRDAVWYDAQPKQLTDDHMRLAHIYRQIGLDAALRRL